MGLFNPGEDRGQGGRGFSPIVIALMMVAFGLFMYWTQTEQNPITGEKQHISISPEQEIKLGLQAAPEMAAQMGGEVPSSNPKAQLVQRIGQKIISQTQARKGPWKFQFHLLADPKTINAFALPGGQVFITLGLLNHLQTEAQLAGVLSHEIGHVIQRHSAQQMTKGELGRIFVMATGVGTSDSQSQQGYMGMAIANIINQVTQLHYSRKDELEADLWGIKLMVEAGYNPKAMIEVLDILEKTAPRGEQPEMLLSHPYPEHRKQQLKTYLQEHPVSGSLTEGQNLKDLIDVNDNEVETKEGPTNFLNRRHKQREESSFPF